MTKLFPLSLVIARLVRATQDRPSPGMIRGGAAPHPYMRRSWVARTSRAMTFFNKFNYLIEYSA